MPQLTSTDHHGPILNRRTERLWIWIDPLGLGKHVRYAFEMEIFDIYQTTSRASVKVGEHVLKQGTRYTDYGGFGTSLQPALNEAQRLYQEFQGANVDITVMTTLEKTPAFFDPDREPFYRKAVMCFDVPHTWNLECTSDDAPMRPERLTQDFEVWKNGKSGENSDFYARRISEIEKADISSEYHSARKVAS